MSAPLDARFVAAGELTAHGWDTLARPSLYVSSAWLRGRSRTIKGAERMLVVDGGGGAPLLGTPGYLVDGRSHPGFDLARALQFGDLPDEAAAAVPGGADALARLRDELRRRAADWHPALVMSAPARFGGVGYAPGLAAAERRAAVDAAVDAVERRAAADGARAAAWLYFLEGDDPPLEAALRARGYLATAIEAECYLPIAWPSIDGYIASFRTDPRRKIRHEMAMFEQGGARAELHGAEALDAELAELERNWRVKYGRTPPLAEILDDYAELRAHVGPHLRVFVARKDGRAIGFTVFLAEGDVWYARFGGFDYAAGPLFLYFNLLFYRPIEAMTRLGVKRAQYSFKSYEAKRSRGCELATVVAFVRPPDGWPRLAGDLAIVDRVQRARFAAVAARRMTSLAGQ